MSEFADFLQDTPASSSPIPDQLLDNLRKTESGKDNLAVNKQTKAMGAYQFLPETVQMLHKQGIKFNPFDEKEARNAARTYLEQLYSKNGGDLQKAVAQYGGFVKADPKNYTEKVLKNVETAPAAPVGSDFSKFLAGEEEPAPVRIELSGMANPAPSVGQQVMQQRQEIPQRIVGAADTLLNALTPAVGTGTQFLERAFGIEGPKEAEQTGLKITQALSNPLGRLAGITNQPAYQKPLGGVTEPYVQTAMQGANKLFNLLGVTPEQLAEKTGQPVEDIRNLGQALPFLAPELAGAARTGTSAVSKAIAERLPKIENYGPNPSLLKPQAAKDGLVGVGAAAVEANPYKGATGEEMSRGAYPSYKLSKITKDVPQAEQLQNAEVANEILGDSGQVRTGVITQNENALRNEHTTSKLNTPEGELLKEQIANEQNALSNYAQKRIENTGANPRLLSDLERGQNVNAAFAGDEGLTGFLKSEKQKLYDEARQKVGDNPIQSTHVDDLFSDPQFKAGAGLKGNEGVLNSAQQLIKLAKETGFKDEFGNVHAANTINAWDAVRKALNADWTPDNASMIRKINQAIDKDISSAGGQELFKKADALHQAEKTLFGSKGIKTIFGDIDPNGVSMATPPDQLMGKLNKLPFEQWRHIYDTADKIASGKLFGPVDEATGAPKWVLDVPEELQAAAQQAKNEITGSLAREVYQSGSKNAGTWNQNEVNKTLNGRADKIKYAFPLDEQRAFNTLNRGGYLMPGIHGYEGGGLQSARVQTLASKLPAAGEALAGAAAGYMFSPLASPVAAVLGRKTGEKMLNAATEKSLLKQAEKARQEMRQNANKPKLMDLGE